MTEKQEKEYIHWQELAEQLGADTTSQIDDYFGGTASFSDIELDGSELPDMLPELTDAVVAGQTMEEAVVSSAPVKIDEAGETVHAQANTISSELDNEIGWNSPQPVKSAAEKTPKNVKTKKKMNKKPAAKTQTKAQSPATTDSNENNHWDSLASTLGLEDSAPETAASPNPPSQEEGAVEPELEINKVTPPAETSASPVAESDGFGAGLIDLCDALLERTFQANFAGALQQCIK